MLEWNILFVRCLFVWVLWHINLCWLFKAKSIFIQIDSFVLFLSLRVFGILSSSLLFFFFHNVSAAVSSGLPQVSSVYLGIDMIQLRKSFLKFQSFLCAHKQGTPEEGRRIQWPKHCEKKPNKDEDNSPKTLTDKNHPASSQKFRQLRQFCFKQLSLIVKNISTSSYSVLSHSSISNNSV